MPGLIGVIQHRRRHDAATLLESIRGPMVRHGGLSWECSSDPRGQWAIGRGHLGTLQPEPQLVENDDGQVLFHGDLHNARELRQALGGGVPDDAGAAAIVAAAYARYGRSFAAHLRGSFSLAVLDRRASTVTIASDRVGSYPLYWAHLQDRFVFASELRSVLQDPDITVTPDPRGVADLLHFGFVCGNRTLADGVSLVGPGSMLTYAWRTGTLEHDAYCHPRAVFQARDVDRATYEYETSEAFARAVERAMTGTYRFGLSLSGGLDSRTVLSAINGKRGSVTAYTVGVEGCADQVLARRLAGIAGTRAQFGTLQPGDAASFAAALQRIVWMTDGLYLTHGLTEIAALDLLETDPPQVLLRGHGGELAKSSLAWPFHTDARVHTLTSTHQVVDYLVDRARVVSPSGAPAHLFAPEFAAAVADGPRRSLEESLAGVELPPADLCSYVYLYEHHRRATVPSLEMFRTSTEVRLPFVDDAFLPVLFGGRPAWREDTSLHAAIIRRHAPALLRVRNSNTGAPVDAGRLRTALSDKINSLLKRLDVYGYRHYHAFGSWMHGVFLPAAEGILLDERARSRGIFQETTLRRVLEETRTGAANHAYLLQGMLILELWQREYES